MRHGTVIYCMECGNPWGAYGHGQGVALMAAFAEVWAESWATDGPDDGTPPPAYPEPLPEPTDTYCVKITEASADWLETLGYEIGVSDVPAWMEFGDWADVPNWWAEPRKRPFTRWGSFGDCCNGLPSDPCDAAGLYEDAAPSSAAPVPDQPNQGDE